MNSARYSEDGFNGYLKHLINDAELNDTQRGIASLVLDKGYDVLTDKQRYVFDKMIDENTVSSCSLCGDSIPWCEMEFALDYNGMCTACVNKFGSIFPESFEVKPSRTKGKGIHVSPESRNIWKVRYTGSSKAFKTFTSKDEAVNFAKKKIRQTDSIFIHDSNGFIKKVL